MFKPALDDITKADLMAMVGTAVEGQNLEFKEDIPVHQTRSREVAKSSGGRARDTWWAECKAVADHGRDELLAELVAFANSRGGRLILGMAEAEDERRAAIRITPLPMVAALEGRFSAFLLEHVEPRLPSARVRAIETESDGSGVLVLETTASVIGPHWVKTTRRPTIRRDDKCLTMSMQEVSQMVLMNSGRLNDIRGALNGRMEGLKRDFQSFLEASLPSTVIAATREQAVNSWLKLANRGAFAFRLALAPHEDFGIVQLPPFSELVPPPTCVGVPGIVGVSGDLTVFWPHGGEEGRILGGVSFEMAWGQGVAKYTVHRDGRIEVTCQILGDDGQALPLPRHMLVGTLGCLLGIYDKLQVIAGLRLVPVEVAVAIITKGRVHVANANSQLAELIGGQLPEWSPFPTRTAMSHDDFSRVMTLTALDMADAANSKVGGPKAFVYFPPLEG